MNNKLKEYEKSNEINLKKMTELYKEINEKDRKIEKLNIKLSRYPLELSIGERLMTVIFTSTDRRILYSIICKNTDIFEKIEDELYEKYPEYRHYENYFWNRGKKINRFKSLEYNRIYNNDIITLELI